MKTTRRKFIKSVGLGTTALAVPGLISFSCMKKTRPNIVFIMSDDHAEQAISCYGSKLINTPQIDRIANEGIRFENSFVTNSICAPSRAVMLTGKYSHVNGLRDNRDEFDGSQVTFPKLLQAAGYQTAVVGKWHLKTEPTGFNTSKILKGQGQYYNPTFFENGQENEYIGYTTDLITDKAIETMNQLEKEKPFCLLVHHKAPHRNWMPNTKHLNKFNDKDFPVPETFHDDYAGRLAAKEADMRINDMYLSFDFKLHKEFYKKETGTGGNVAYAANAVQNWENAYNRLTAEQKAAWDAHYDKINQEFKKLNLSGEELLNWKYQHYIKDYLRCILSLDENVGRLLDYLDQNGLTENTIVVYTSDQGFYLGEHGWYDKRFMYEESLGMPLVMRYPSEIQSGQVTQKMVMNLDFASTFLDFAGVEIPKEMQGQSMRSIVKGKSANDWRESIYYHYYEYPHGWHNVKRHCGVRTAQYKLIHFYQDNYWELFDLKNDIHEMHNVYENPEYEQTVIDMKKELKRLQQLYGDTDFE
jgi:arylsulfatase A-like enzyme